MILEGYTTVTLTLTTRFPSVLGLLVGVAEGARPIVRNSQRHM